RRFGEDPELYLWMSVAELERGRIHDSDTYLSRCLELFGDDSSNLYCVVSAVGPRIDRDREAARKLLGHWIPILQSKLGSAPDNDRVLGALIGLEGYAGEVPAMRSDIDRYRRRTGDPGVPITANILFGFCGAGYAGDHDAARRLIGTIRGTDLMN